MARVARKHIVDGRKGGFHHCLNRISGYPWELPFRDPLAVTNFIARLRGCILRTCFQCAGFVLMGNHFHLVLFAEQFRKLSRRKLERRAKARWGRLWGDRFKSLALGHDLAAVQEQLLYVELNPVRAGLVDLPRQYKACSAYLRAIGKADWLIPLERLFPELARGEAVAFYRALLLHRGLEPTRENQASIPVEVAARELDRRFPPGLYRRRRRFMTDGLMMGSKDRMVQELERLTLEGVYRRRRSVKQHLDGLFYTIREQRSNYTR